MTRADTYGPINVNKKNRTDLGIGFSLCRTRPRHHAQKTETKQHKEPPPNEGAMCVLTGTDKHGDHLVRCNRADTETPPSPAGRDSDRE